MMALGAALILSGCATAPAAGPGFSHLRVAGGAISTTGPVRLTVAAPPGFRAVGPIHRRAEFGGHPYEVSLAGLLGEREAVLVHGERVTDSSGASNYDDLPRSGWPSPAYGLRSFCVTVTPEMAVAEHDLAWLRDRGWNPAGGVAMDQYLATTADHNHEAVLSLVVRGVDCTDQAAVRRALDALRSRLRIRTG